MGVIAVLGVIALAVLQRLLADEIKAWLPGLASRLARFAVLRMPEAQRERFEEEWQSHLDETPGDLTKVFEACGFLLTTYRTMPIYIPKINLRVAFQSFRREREVIEAIFEQTKCQPSVLVPPDAKVKIIEVNSITGCIPFSGLLRLRLLAAFRPTKDWNVRYGRSVFRVAKASVLEAEKDPTRHGNGLYGPPDYRLERSRQAARAFFDKVWQATRTARDAETTGFLDSA